MIFKVKTKSGRESIEYSLKDKPTVLGIKKLALNEGFKAKNINIWFDSIQKFWGASADIEKLEAIKGKE